MRKARKRTKEEKEREGERREGNATERSTAPHHTTPYHSTQQKEENFECVGWLELWVVYMIRLMYLPVFQPGIPYVFIQKQPFSVFVFVIVLVWYGLVHGRRCCCCCCLFSSLLLFLGFRSDSLLAAQYIFKFMLSQKKIRGPIVLILGRMLYRIIPESAVG